MLILLFMGLLLSYKSNSNTNGEGYNSDVDSIQSQVDTTSMCRYKRCEGKEWYGANGSGNGNMGIMI